jgi:hypothetical protein
MFVLEEEEEEEEYWPVVGHGYTGCFLSTRPTAELSGALLNGVI